LAALACANALAQSAPAPAEFVWRATLEVPPQASLVRVPVPAGALARLQTRDASDLRVFDAQSQPVPFAFSTVPLAAEPPRQPTRAYAALPLYSAKADARAPKGSVQVRINEGGQQRSLWVQMTPSGPAAVAPAAAQRLPSALFDTRGEKETITALRIQGQLPANAPVRVTLSTSSDLASWTPVAARGRLYRFEGDGAPANDTLELLQPLKLEKQYLRLEWDGQQGVTVDTVSGLIAPAVPKREPVVAALPTPRADGNNALEWELGFATPLLKLEVTLQRPNTLVPLRILGRNQVSEPWRTLGHTVAWRLGEPGSETNSEPADLQRASVRWLRLEATHGMKLEAVPLTARAVFDPLQVVFVAGANGPFMLAAGRAETPRAALPLGMIAAASTRKIDELPAAKVGAVQDQPPAPGALAAWLPRGVDTKTAVLWAVLGFGVLMLGAVAWSLLRQLKAPPAAPRAGGS
jgi:hypothetical protein